MVFSRLYVHQTMTESEVKLYFLFLSMSITHTWAHSILLSSFIFCICIVCKLSLWKQFMVCSIFTNAKLIRIAFNKSHISRVCSSTNNAVILKTELSERESSVCVCIMCMAELLPCLFFCSFYLFEMESKVPCAKPHYLRSSGCVWIVLCFCCIIIFDFKRASIHFHLEFGFGFSFQATPKI